MVRQGNRFAPTRRGLLATAAGVYIAGWRRLEAFSSDFWNKKEPAEWSREEIEQLTTKSPWAKEVSAQLMAPDGDETGGMGGGPRGGTWPEGGGMGGPRIGGMGGGRGGMGGPGMGGPGMGGPGMGGGRGRRGSPMQSFRGTIRWESAQPVLEAMKTPLPEAFANHYVISVSGFPMMTGSRRGSPEEDRQQSASEPNENLIEHLKAATLLKPKDRDGVQPGVVEQQPSAGGRNFLFGFSRETLALKPEDKDVTFSTQLGRMVVKTKFNLKEMMYHTELAV